MGSHIPVTVSHSHSALRATKTTMSHQPPQPSLELPNITQESTGTENSIELNEKLNGASNDENVKIIEDSPANEKSDTAESKQGENNDVAVPESENENDEVGETNSSEEGTV